MIDLKEYIATRGLQVRCEFFSTSAEMKQVIGCVTVELYAAVF